MCFEVYDRVKYIISNNTAVVGTNINENSNALVDIENTKKVKLIPYIHGFRVLTIGKYAFCKSNIEYIWIPKTVEVMKLDCLAHIQVLKTVEFEEESNLREYEQGIFYNDSKLRTIHLPNRLQISVQYIFTHCHLDSVFYYGMFEFNQKMFFHDAYVGTDVKNLYVCKNYPYSHFAEITNIQKNLECDLPITINNL